MEERIINPNTIADFKQLGLNFSPLLKHLSKKSPEAYNHFDLKTPGDKMNYKALIDFYV